MEVKLFGAWTSAFSYRVIWAPKIKGIEYEYVEENLSNKSELLLQYNPVYKKIPVLVHAGKPIAESIVILEYIEETWPHNPLLPKDPYGRAMARFWIKFGEDKEPSFRAFFESKGEEQEKAGKELLEALRTIEEHCLRNNKFFGGEVVGMVDLTFGWLAHWFEMMEETVGVKLMEAHTLPHLHQWKNDFKQVPLIKENLPDYDEALVYMKHVRDRFVASDDALKYNNNNNNNLY